MSIHVVGAAIIQNGRCLIGQRGPTMSMPGKWEFPGGRVESGEHPAEALARELREELNLEATIGEWLRRGEATENGRQIIL